MQSVDVKLLNSHLSEYVRLAASGETILCTDRGWVVAEIEPPKQSRNPLLADSLLADAVRKGWLRPPVLPPKSAPPEPRPVATLNELVAELGKGRS